MTKATNFDLSHARLQDLLSYDPDTGLFHWRVNRGRLAKAGNRAGSTNGRTTHVRLHLDGTFYYGQRLAWLHFYGTWPTGNIDHIDGDPSNNRISNLRDVTHRVNLQNQRRARSDSQSGLLGACYHKRIGKFQAGLKVGTKIKHLGYFDNAEEAHSAYVQAKRIHHEGCTI